MASTALQQQRDSLMDGSLDGHAQPNVWQPAVAEAPHISVCICTYKRPVLLAKLLDHLARLTTDDRFTYSIVVADNDASRSAEPVVRSFAAQSAIDVIYTIEPRQNIALARNEVLRHARGQYIAFIDDDEFPEPDWLLTMLDACRTLGASGVLGPVRPQFDAAPPQWIIDGKFCERREYPTGRIMPWEECRTGNLLFRKDLLDTTDEPFDERFATGGEDVDFFLRMTKAGHIFKWCNEGIVYEAVPPERWTRAYMLRRALLRGRNILKLPSGQLRLVSRSLLATPIYATILPFTLVFGHHVFMKYCIRLCDHIGRLLAVARLNPVSER